jgi:SPP1 gp7 family putative phage head morphogenesis protein
MTTPTTEITTLTKTERHIARSLITNILLRLAPRKQLIEKAGPFGIFIGSAKDDTAKREIEMFRVLRNTLADQMDKDIKGGPAIGKFLKDGVKIKGGKTLQYNKALKELNKSLEKSLGPDVAKKTVKNISEIIDKQWLATKSVIADSIKQAGRAINKGITNADKAVLNVLKDQNNFFVSGMYGNAKVVNTVNKVVGEAVEKGLPRRELNTLLRNRLVKQIPNRSDIYYNILAGDVLNRSRTFAQINSMTEARVRRFEIIAILDSRTTEICQHMDGRVFEVEIGRKIIRDIKRFGIPGNEGEVDKFKALRPWMYFDKSRAKDGKDALYFRDANREKIFLPDSGFKQNRAGRFKPLGKKGPDSEREIIDVTPRNSNPPMLPPYHAHCRTTVVVDEDDIISQEWAETLSGSTLAPGQKLINDISGKAVTVTQVGTSARGRGKIKIKDTKGKEKTVNTREVLQDYSVESKPKILPKEQDVLDAERIKKGIKPPKNTNLEKIVKEKRIFLAEGSQKTGKKLTVGGERDLIVTTLNDFIPDNAIVDVEKIIVHDKTIKFKVLKKPNTVGLYSKKEKTLRVSRFDPEKLEQLSALKKQKIIIHEMGHHVWNHRLGENKDKIQRAWRKLDKGFHRKKKVFISDLAKDGHEEHFSETFRMFYFKPDILKAEQPEAFGFFEKNIKSLLGKTPKELGGRK